VFDNFPEHMTLNGYAEAQEHCGPCTVSLWPFNLCQPPDAALKQWEVTDIAWIISQEEAPTEMG
jgi:hypothetical protein